MDSPLRERVTDAISRLLGGDKFVGIAVRTQPQETGGREQTVVLAGAMAEVLADAAISTLTLSDHIAAVEASGTHVMTDAEYNALAAARKYVWAARAAMRVAEVADQFKQRKLAVIDADLAKIDAVIDAVDRLAARPRDA